MRSWSIVICLLLAGCAEQEQPPQADGRADLILTNGSIYTVANDQEWATTIAIRGEEIVYVGDEAGSAAWHAPTTRLIDLDGHLVLPAFQDAHIHPVSGGVEALACDLNALDDVAAYRTRILEYATSNPELPWILGGGWSMAEFGPGARPRKGILDELVPNRPVFLTSLDGHTAWVNSLALEIAGITPDTPNPVDGVIDRDPLTGELIGSLQEGAMDLVRQHIPATDPATLISALAYSRDMLHAYGITSIQVAYADEADLQAMTSLDTEGALNLRLAVNLWWDRERGVEQIAEFHALRDEYTTGNVRVTGVKIMQDGVMENYTAVMLEPYLIPEQTRGIPMVEPDLLKRIVTQLDADEFQVHFHAIGDGAVRQSLDAIETARDANEASDNRHHISHLELIHPDDIDRFAELDTIANFQPLWAFPDRYITELTVPFIGEERAGWLYPIGSVLRAGGQVAFGSDWSVTTANPFPQIETAVTRTDPDADSGGVLLPAERITLAQAIEAFTINAAWVNHLEEQTGSLESGKLADLIVLDQNLFEIDPTAISETRVLLTLFGGNPVYGSFDFEE